VIFHDEPTPSIAASGIGVDFLPRIAVSALAGVVLFFGVMPGSLVARIIASVQ